MPMEKPSPSPAYDTKSSEQKTDQEKNVVTEKRNQKTTEKKKYKNIIQSRNHVRPSVPIGGGKTSNLHQKKLRRKDRKDGNIK